MTTDRAPKRRKLALVFSGVALAAFACVIAVLAITGTGWFAKTPATHQVELRVESSTDFEVAYLYWTPGGKQVSEERSAIQTFTAEFEAGPGSIQFQAYMPQGTGRGGVVRCSMYIDGLLAADKVGDAGSVNCNSSIADD